MGGVVCGSGVKFGWGVMEKSGEKMGETVLTRI